MPLSAGTRLGAYEIISPLGAGGMGEVYRARDLKLGRSVAIKVLPETVATYPDRIARFEREAKVLASLNHPHIAALFGMEESAGRHFLVMELVEGETLAERIASPNASGHGHLRVEDALKIALQLAGALEAAHESGIIHRDLKPANIMITPDAVVKVLDFGLAKAIEGDRSRQDPSGSPTISFGGTREGVILGTAAYMSPEQARGKPVDKRTDIWAFGCVMYEMLTGRLAFSGETASDAVAAILSRDPDWLALPAETPESLRRLLRRSLEKDPKRRVHDIADARIELEETLFQSAESARLTSTDRSALIGTNGARARTRVRLAWISATLSVAAIVASLALGRVGPFGRASGGHPRLSFLDRSPRGHANSRGPQLCESQPGRTLCIVARRTSPRVRGETGWNRTTRALGASAQCGCGTEPGWNRRCHVPVLVARLSLRRLSGAGQAEKDRCGRRRAAHVV